MIRRPSQVAARTTLALIVAVGGSAPARTQDRPTPLTLQQAEQIAVQNHPDVQFAQDIAIWENKIYRERPFLCDGDGPIAPFRRWAKQFYVEAT